jgi:SAM-dependent methyltransferase
MADALQLPFRDGSVNAVYSVHVLHLIEDWQGALREMARVSKEAYYTIATYRQEENTPHRRYWEVVREAGFQRQTPGIYERELPDIIPPRERIVLGTFEERLQASEMITDLEGRIYSGQWSLPDDVHGQALEAVKAEFSDEEIVLRKRVELIRWSPEDLHRG